MDADVGVEGAGGDGEGVPLLLADRGDVDEEPLAGLVAHGRLGELDFHCVVWVADDLHDLGLTTRSDFAVDALDEVEAARPELPPPALVSDAVVPEVGTRKGREVVDGIANEAVGGVGVEAEHERNEEMVSVPERLEGLLSYLCVCGRVHE